MSWETVYWASQLLLVVLAGVALISGAVVNTRQSRQLLTMETTLQEQRQKTAETELKLEHVRAAQKPRRISDKSFAEALEGKKAATKVTLLYLRDDGEAYNFAQSIWWELVGAGWNPSHPAPIPSDIVTDLGRSRGVLPDVPITSRAGGQPTGVSIVANKIDGPPVSPEDSAYSTLFNAFLACGMSVGGGVDTTLSNDELRLIIGAKP